MSSFNLNHKICIFYSKNQLRKVKKYCKLSENYFVLFGCRLILLKFLSFKSFKGWSWSILFFFSFWVDRVGWRWGGFVSIEFFDEFIGLF